MHANWPIYPINPKVCNPKKLTPSCDHYNKEVPKSRTDFKNRNGTDQTCLAGIKNSIQFSGGKAALSSKRCRKNLACWSLLLDRFLVRVKMRRIKNSYHVGNVRSIGGSQRQERRTTAIFFRHLCCRYGQCRTQSFVQLLCRR